MAGSGDSTPQVWEFTYGEHVLRQADITVGQAERIEKLTGKSWLLLNPVASAAHARAIVRVMGADASGKSEDEVGAEIAAMRVDEYLDLLQYRNVDDDKPSGYTDGIPHSAAEPTTRTSSSSPKRPGSGRRK